MHEPHTHQLERSSTFPSLAPPAERLATAPDRLGAGRQQRGRQPVDETRPPGGTRGPAPPATTGHASAVVFATAGSPARALASRSRSLWLPGSALDSRSDCGGHQRDEVAIARWREETWPALNRGPKPKGKRSSSSLNPGALPCPVSSAPMPQ